MSDPARALSAVLGRGSAHEGAHHWRAQRLTAVALLLLGPWFAISMARLPDFSYGSVHGFLSGLCRGRDQSRIGSLKIRFQVVCGMALILI